MLTLLTRRDAIDSLTRALARLHDAPDGAAHPLISVLDSRHATQPNRLRHSTRAGDGAVGGTALTGGTAVIGSHTANARTGGPGREAHAAGAADDNGEVPAGMAARAMAPGTSFAEQQQRLLRARRGLSRELLSKVLHSYKTRDLRGRPVKLLDVCSAWKAGVALGEEGRMPRKGMPAPASSSQAGGDESAQGQAGVLQQAAPGTQQQRPVQQQAMPPVLQLAAMPAAHWYGGPAAFQQVTPATAQQAPLAPPATQNTAPCSSNNRAAPTQHARDEGAGSSAEREEREQQQHQQQQQQKQQQPEHVLQHSEHHLAFGSHGMLSKATSGREGVHIGSEVRELVCSAWESQAAVSGSTENQGGVQNGGEGQAGVGKSSEGQVGRRDGKGSSSGTNPVRMMAIGLEGCAAHVMASRTAGSAVVMRGSKEDRATGTMAAATEDCAAGVMAAGTGDSAAVTGDSTGDCAIEVMAAGTGDCAAIKLLHAAASDPELEPVGLLEFWYGAPVRKGGPKQRQQQQRPGARKSRKQLREEARAAGARRGRACVRVHAYVCARAATSLLRWRGR